MHFKHQKTLLIASLALLNITPVLAATPVSLDHKPASYLAAYMTPATAAIANAVTLTPISHETDFRQVTHTRLNQNFNGYPVWDAQAIVHSANSTDVGRALLANNNQTTVTGTIYEGIDKDLANAPTDMMSDAQKAKAMDTLKQAYAQKSGQSGIAYQQESVKAIVYVDDNNVSHYAFLASFFCDDGKTGAHKPTAIIDATSLKVYKLWDNVFTYSPVPSDVVPTTAGGVGGNDRTGDYVYDGSSGHLPTLPMSSDMVTMNIGSVTVSVPMCYLSTKDITIVDTSYDQIASGLCIGMPGQHNGVNWLATPSSTYWDADAFNGGHSPSLDALYSGVITQAMYKEWYRIPVLTQPNGKSMNLLMRVHYGRNYDNAFWDGEKMTYGDGDTDTFYPFTTLDVGAHEISHGFTQQHSNLDASLMESAALHESFSDMASMATQYYTTQTCSWIQGAGLFKNSADGFRYMDDPTKDGKSIANVKDYNPATAVDPHLVAGVFNKAFYLLATTPGWNARKAFNVMVEANRFYWTPKTTFQSMACGVVKAADDYQYSQKDIETAFAGVGIDTKKC